MKLLGTLEIAVDGQPLQPFVSRKSDALLVYLALQGRPIARDALTTLLWPDLDTSRALANLSVCLNSLRKQLNPFIQADRYTVALQPNADAAIDVYRFDSAIRAVRSRARGTIGRSDALQLAAAIRLYEGEFLAGFYIRNADGFESWLLLERERLHQLALQALHDLTGYYLERSQYVAGIAVAQRLLALEPLHEEGHRRLMRLYALSGHRAQALAQFDRLSEILATELAISPDEESFTLFAQIRDREPAAAPAETVAVVPDRPLDNLPAATTRFIGRARDLDAILAYLDDPDWRLLTLTGLGGSGKTRLALEAAAQRRGDFADGVWFLSLAGLTTASQLPALLADILNLTLSAERPVAQQVLDYLTRREMLLLLDNYETIGGDVDFVIALLRSAPEIKLLVTSRTRLDLQAEALMEVSGLDYPRQPASDAADYDAVRLFIHRAGHLSRQPLTGSEALNVITAVCALVDGLPLAIELAASWLRKIPLERVRDEITKGLAILSTTWRDVPERHRSLHAVFDYSWQLLSVEEQQAMQRLAVFRDGFTAPAAEQVAGVNLDPLAGLVDKSLLSLDKNDRYRRHPLVFQYALEKLIAEPATHSAVQMAHGRYFAQQLAQLGPRLLDENILSALAEIQADLENARIAWQHAIANRHWSAIWDMTTAVCNFFRLRSQFLEATHWLGDAHAALQSDLPEAQAQLFALLTVRRGQFYYLLSDLDTALPILEEGLALARAVDWPKEVSGVQHTLGVLAEERGDYARAGDYYRAALVEARRIADPRRIWIFLSSLCILSIQIGDNDAGERYIQESLALSESSGDISSAAHAHVNLGMLAYLKGEYDEAERQYAKSLELSIELEDEVGIGTTLQYWADTKLARGEYTAARDQIERALRHHESANRQLSLALDWTSLSRVLLAQGQTQEAREAARRALSTALAIDARTVALDAIVALAEIAAATDTGTLALASATFVVEHPAASAQVRQRAQTLRDRLQQTLSPQNVAEAAQRAQTLTIETFRFTTYDHAN